MGAVMDDLPAPVAEIVTAINESDTDRFVAAFTEDGVVDDWGRRFEGRDAVRGWSDREAIGAGARMTPTEAVTDDGPGHVGEVRLHWRKHTFVFTLTDNLVAELRIPPH